VSNAHSESRKAEGVVTVWYWGDPPADDGAAS
jgi:hypothetical protein